MSLDELTEDITDEYSDLDDEFTVSLDRCTPNGLPQLSAACEPDDPEELVRRGVHLLYRQTVDSGDLDFHLRSGYDVTYDEYLSGMTYDEMTGGDVSGPARDDNDRRYNF